jgi:calpain-15
MGAKSECTEAWVLLLEKAIAKYCGGYDMIIGGKADWALKVIAGDQVEAHFCFSNKQVRNT